MEARERKDEAEKGRDPQDKIGARTMGTKALDSAFFF
jgi:hypothetical protein